MHSKVDDISKIIKEQIRNYAAKTKQDEIGYVISVGDGIAKVHGMENCRANELVEFVDGTLFINGENLRKWLEKVKNLK
jgi:F-type H+-transporting ATPase subunit alpha